MMLEHFDGPYFIDGDALYFRSQSGTTKVCDTTELFGVGYDAEEPMLLKHGQASRVAEYMETLTVAFSGSHMPGLAEELTFLTFSIGPETIEEVNACIHITNRVGKLPERLEMLANGEGLGPTLQ
jgi:hypothetical protein